MENLKNLIQAIEVIQQHYPSAEIISMNEYNARQFEISLNNGITLDANLYEQSICEINPKTRVRTNYITLS